MRRFLAPAIPDKGERIVLEDAASHHLLRVVGIAPGERVGIFDGQGASCEAALVGVEGGRAVIECVAPASPNAAAREVWLLASVLRAPVMQSVVRAGTELGATHIWPIAARRSVAKGDQSERWRRIAAAAAAQCGRADVPDVRAPAALADALSALPASPTRVVFVPGLPPQAPVAGPAALLLGPEGGLAPDEIQAALEAGFEPAGLGALVLRADTAATAALARWMV
jgi:16S rRNA (uracil1498-N3)-methyltransferase